MEGVCYLVQHGLVISPRREAVVYSQAVDSATIGVTCVHVVTMGLTVQPRTCYLPAVIRQVSDQVSDRAGFQQVLSLAIR